MLPFSRKTHSLASRYCLTQFSELETSQAAHHLTFPKSSGRSL